MEEFVTSARPGTHTVFGALATIAAGAILAACGGSGDASTGGSPSPSGAYAFSACMRAHGIPDFPDPDSNGQYPLRGGGDLNPNSPQFQAAQRACQSTSGGGPGGSGASRAQSLQFSQCMRAHGITDFPDPGPDGSLTLPKGGAGSDLDPNNAQFKAASQACQHYLTASPSGGQP